VELKAHAQDYSGVGQDACADPRVVLEALGGRVKAGVAARQDLETRARSRALSAEDRAELIEEPFLLLNPRLEERKASTHFDKQSSFAFLGMIAIGILLSILEDHLRDPLASICGVAMGSVVAVGGLFGVYSVLTDVGRFAKRKIDPLIVGSLRPLSPSQEELERTLQKLKSLGYLIAKKLDAARLARALGPAPAGTMLPHRAQ
jgi:hypothetical protein